MKQIKVENQDGRTVTENSETREKSKHYSEVLFNLGEERRTEVTVKPRMTVSLFQKFSQKTARFEVEKV